MGYIFSAEKDADWCGKGYRFAAVGHRDGSERVAAPAVHS